MAQQQDPILEHRLAALEKNLEQVKQIKASIMERRREIEQLLRIFDDPDVGVQWAFPALQKQIELALTFVRHLDVPESARRQLLRTLGAAQKNTRRIGSQFKNASSAMSSIEARWFEISVEDFDWHMDRIFADKESEVLSHQISNLEAELAGDDLPYPDEAHPDGRSLWERYQATLRQGGEELFGEYVDFLGGWALRSTGVDRGICQMADDLVQRFYYVGGAQLWHSMAIPARQNATAWTLARIIRLGFPEWTVWAIPLSAHEFGRVILRFHDYWREYMDDEAGTHDRRQLETHLADAFATYAMGPAYVFAAMFLRFEPISQEQTADQRSSDDERVWVVFRMLQLMNEEGQFDGVEGGLRPLWETALEGAGAQPHDPAREDFLGRWTADMWKFLRDEAHSVRYGGKRWEAVKGWRTNLTKMKLLGRDDDIRDVLNAAWYQRMDNAAPADDLALAALRLWRNRPSKQAGTGGAGSVRGPQGR